MAVQDVVRLLGMYVEDDGETMRERYGPEAVSGARDTVQMLSTRLEEESPHVDLWDAFRENPSDHTAELIGVLEAMVEADPALARRLDGFAQEFYKVLGPPGEEQPTGSRRVAEVGGDALDTAVEPEKETGPRNRIPYRPDTAANVDFKDSVDRGAYLYGNVKGGKDTVGREAGAETFEFTQRDARPTRLASLSGLPGLVEELSAAISDHPAIDDVDKHEAQVELQIVSEEIQRAESVDPARLTRHLLALHEKAPDVGEVVMRALESVELPPAVAEVVADVRLQLP